MEPSSQLPPTSPSTPPTEPSTPVIPPRRRSKPLAELLAEEAIREQKRHEETEAKTDRFLALFERMVEKL